MKRLEVVCHKGSKFKLTRMEMFVDWIEVNCMVGGEFIHTPTEWSTSYIS